jgi:rhodanese-related sulfurtransferase
MKTLWLRRLLFLPRLSGVFVVLVTTAPDTFAGKTGDGLLPARVINVGVLPADATTVFAVPVPARWLGGGEHVVVGLQTSCDCLVFRGELPLEASLPEPVSPVPSRPDSVLSGKQEPHVDISLAYTPRETGLWGTDVRLSVTAPSGDEYEQVLRLRGVAFDPSWTISAEEAVTTVVAGAAGASVVDIRGRTLWQAAQVPGSLSMTPRELARAGELKRRPVVLIGNSLDDAAALEEVVRLRQQHGFTNIRIVSGGLAAWMRAGGAVTGRDPSHALQVTPDEVLSASLLADWRMVGPQGEPDAGKHVIPDVLPPSRLSPRPVFPEPRKILLVAEDRAGFLRIEARLPSTDRVRALHLAGGRRALEDAARMQVAAGQEGPRITVLASRGASVRSGPCGGCGRK